MFPFAITKCSASTIAVSSRPGEERPGQASYRECSIRARNRGREGEQSTANYERTSEPLSSVEDVYLVRILIVSERVCVYARATASQHWCHSFPAGKEERKRIGRKVVEEAVQRLRGARACAGLLTEQVNANHPNGE